MVGELPKTPSFDGQICFSRRIWQAGTEVDSLDIQLSVVFNPMLER